MCVFSVTQESTFKAVNQFRDSILRVLDTGDEVCFFVLLFSFCLFFFFLYLFFWKKKHFKDCQDHFMSS